jgi:hypothetical protein
VASVLLQMQRFDESLRFVNEAIEIFRKKQTKEDDPIYSKLLQNKVRIEAEMKAKRG